MEQAADTRRWLGIDFSGNHLMWRRRARRGNVWIATLTAGGGAGPPHLADVRRVQDLDGSEAPFDRLAARLRRLDYRVACVDAPLCVPSACLPSGGHEALATALHAAAPADRPFARGAALVARVLPAAAPRGEKRYRRCEQRWREAGLSVRSATWDGPRGGAPLAAAALTLVARCRRPVWPWATTDAGPGLLAEGYPAAQLVTWGLSPTGYGRDDAASEARRVAIAEAIAARGVRLGAHRAAMIASPDALDAVLAGMCAWALDRDRLVDAPPPGTDDGWIAVGR